MNHIGEFSKKAKILLELLTLDKNSKHITVDFPPTVSIERLERHGIEAIDSVKLETMDRQSLYSSEFTIPENWDSGEYIFTYQTIIKGKTYTKKEQFTVVSDSIPGFDISLKSSSQPDNEMPNSIVVSDGDDYVLSPEFQVPTDISVEGDKVEITFKEAPKYNHTYQVVFGDGIKSVSGSSLGGMKISTFTSKYEPIFATPLEVKNIIRSLFKYFSSHEVYSALRDAGQKALQYLGKIPDANNSRYRALKERDTAYFATTKYVAFEASRLLLTGLMVRILNDSEDQDDGVGSITKSTSGGTIQLGDFMVQDKSSSSNGSGGNSGVKEESPLKKLQTMISENEKEIKFWLDSMMGHNKRGYAKPVSGSFRTAAGSPEGRGF